MFAETLTRPPSPRRPPAAPPLAAFLATILLAALFFAAKPALAQTCPPTPAQPLALPEAAARLTAGQPLRIIAFGSSSTEGAGATSPAATYPAQLEARLRAALPNREVTVINRGRGGEDALEMLARLDAEVIAADPSLVIWQLGANAAMRGLDPERFRAALDQGLARLRARGIETILLDNQRAPRIAASPEREAIAANLAAAAAAQQVPLFSRTALMRAWENAGLANAAVIGPDGIHHTDRGYACLAEAMARAILGGLRPGPALARR